VPLASIIKAVDETLLTSWEAKFMTDMRERFCQYESRIRITLKQWNVLQEIDAKLNCCNSR
jgi:hypothetical protein